ncbi:MAG: HAMP domain-containing histidine kinase [Actinomycetales bacterium]|nr:HAMP domain-containing histidine kinase [Actinomycetales bacterium]
MDRVSLVARRVSRAVTRWPLRAVRRWRSSLQLRVLSTTMLLGLVAVALIGTFLSQRISEDLFERRTAEVLQEAARGTRQAQSNFDASAARTSAEITELFQYSVQQSLLSGSADRSVFLLRSPGPLPPVVVNEFVTNESLRSLITPELRGETAEAEGGQRWQSVAIPRDPAEPGAVTAGIMVGSTVQVNVAGQYELYFLFPLGAEQEVLGFVQRTMAIGGVFLVALLVAMTWLVTSQTVRPVRTAARVAERLADGHLTERMHVRGQDEMATLARSFNEMAESLQDQIERMEQLSALQRTFVSDVSHELRTPMTTVRIAAEVIAAEREDFPPALRRSAELLTTQLDRFEELLADLLEISRFDAGAAVLDAERRDVRDVVASAVDTVSSLAQRRGSWLSVDVPERATHVDLDPRRVERILRNLLVNAIEHADGTDVEVTVGVDERAVAICVRDYGVGLSQEAAEHVFDRFWRADKARARTTGGTGLGLAISLEDAHLHGGWLEAWGRPGLGANFRLTLPRRAGIQLTESPLLLVPDNPMPAARAVHAETQEASPGRGADPAAIPDLDRLEVR